MKQQHIFFASKKPSIALPFLFVFYFIGCNWQCNQQPRLSLKEGLNAQKDQYGTNQDTITSKKKIVSKGIITFTQEGKYPSLTFYFHNDEGKVVKTIREDQFPVNNPIFKLGFPKKSNNDRLHYYLPLTNSRAEKEHSQVKVVDKTKKLANLEKYGLHVKNPEIASNIIGSPTSNPPSITLPLSKYLVRCEVASIYYKHAKDSTDSKGNTLGNSLLDCSYLTVYNNLGVVIQELQVPNKCIKVGWVSDDGKYLFCGYSFGFIWEEGPSSLPGGFLIIDLKNKAISEVQIPRFKEYSDGMYGFFADDYFQMGYGSYDFLYVNPYDRVYHEVKYQQEQLANRKMASCCNSFTPYEGLKIDLSQYPKNNY